MDVQELWDQVVYRIWLSDRDLVLRARSDDLISLGENRSDPVSEILYRASAARIADAMARDALLAPLGASVIPLPHQIRALARATASHRVRYLLADEVGLGKTIEAGLILRELKLRGLVRRALVVAPKGLVSQWVAELRTHFNEVFHPIATSDLKALRGLSVEMVPTVKDQPNGARTASLSPWRLFDQVVCSLDAVKPIDSRRGWSRDEIARSNRERFEDLIAANWDLIIVDEAHRLAGSTDQVARYRLGQGLASGAPYLLLLSATPHQGKTDGFHRLMSLLDPDDFPDPASLTRERIQPYVIRTEKRQAIDARGQPLFQPRQTHLTPAFWSARHQPQRLLYELVSDYVREGYGQALQERRNYVGFLLLLMQRLVTSSTRAIRVALERRLDVLQGPDEPTGDGLTLSDGEWQDLDGQEQIDALLGARLAALQNERSEVTHLLETARSAEASGPDAKAEALLEWITQLQRQEVDPDLKVLIFTEFVPTQEMLRAFLTDRSFSVVCLNGTMDVPERHHVQDDFARDDQILISTDAGGEGLNLQFCHVVVNYDIPWNPMRLEQRIGRVDRIGQTKPVLAINLVLGDTVEHRVQEVLSEKLAVIKREFGVDKTGDVLDSAEAGEIFERLYREGILQPDGLDRAADLVASEVRAQALAAEEASALLRESGDLDPAEARRVLEHPLPRWVERMTVSYLKAHAGKVEHQGDLWHLVWPNGSELRGVAFTARDAEASPGARQLTLDDERVRTLATRLPRAVSGQPIARIILPGLPSAVTGAWSLWRVVLHTPTNDQERIMPLYLHADGRVFAPTAERVWDALLVETPASVGYLTDSEAERVFGLLQAAAEERGRAIYEELLQRHQSWLTREVAKGEYAFAARRRVIERVGLTAVRGHRLTALGQERQAWRAQLDRQATVSPELVLLLLVSVMGSETHG
ncbi:MAG TPA: helicase-related protein [Chloroflexota bacterium]|nr:helicase-related protein [Chloroflexota bacterium]